MFLMQQVSTCEGTHTILSKRSLPLSTTTQMLLHVREHLLDINVVVYRWYRSQQLVNTSCSIGLRINGLTSSRSFTLRMVPCQLRIRNDFALSEHSLLERNERVTEEREQRTAEGQQISTDSILLLYLPITIEVSSIKLMRKTC